MSAPDDLVDLLLPDATPAEAGLARRVLNFARLLASDARRPTPATGTSTLEVARSDFEESSRRTMLDSLEDLIRQLLWSMVPPDSFAWFGTSHSSYADAWAAVIERREELSPKARVPEPGESVPAVAQRLLEEACQVGLSPHRAALWQGRLAWASAGARAVEAHWEELLTSLDPPEVELDVWEQALAHAVEGQLERGRVDAALDLIAEHARRGELPLRVLRLREWCQVLRSGDCPSAPTPGVFELGPLPEPLVELRERMPALLPALPGKGRTAWDVDALPLRRTLHHSAPLERESCGATVLAVWSFLPRQGLELVHWDAAPAVQSQARRALQERALAHSCLGALERRVVLEARPQRTHGEGGRRPLGALCDGIRAVALVPLTRRPGEVGGWLELQLGHHLVPSLDGLRALAEAVELPREGGSGAWQPRAELAAQAPRWLHDATAVEPFRALAVTFETLLLRTGAKTSCRHWYGVLCEGEDALLIAHGGSLGWSYDSASAGLALRRVWASATPWLYGDPEEGLGLARECCSGIVVPIVWGGRVRGLFALESSRRGDFRESDLERFVAAASALALDVHVGAFAAWHVERFGRAIQLPCESPAAREWAERVTAGGRTRHPCSISGPCGVGKTILARWLHYESERRALGVGSHGCAGDPDLLRLELDPSLGTLVLEGIEHLSPAGQERWLRWIERDERRAGTPMSGPRWIATWGEGSSLGATRGDLRGLLERWHYAIVPLCDRREEIPGWVRFFLAREAEERGLPVPELQDDAMALLWRQAWVGNLRELESITAQLLALDPAGRWDAERIARVMQRFGHQVVTRLPSRHPRRIDLEAALSVTQTAGGRRNKTRAAAYLGWDPDTLTVRLRELGKGATEPVEEAGEGEGDVTEDAGASGPGE